MHKLITFVLFNIKNKVQRQPCSSIKKSTTIFFIPIRDKLTRITKSKESKVNAILAQLAQVWIKSGSTGMHNVGVTTGKKRE